MLQKRMERNGVKMGETHLQCIKKMALHVKTRCSLYGTECGQNFVMSVGAIDDNVKDSPGCTTRGSRDNLSQ
jgi:hypothetical protein